MGDIHVGPSSSEFCLEGFLHLENGVLILGDTPLAEVMADLESIKPGVRRNVVVSVRIWPKPIALVGLGIPSQVEKSEPPSGANPLPAAKP